MACIAFASQCESDINWHLILNYVLTYSTGQMVPGALVIQLNATALEKDQFVLDKSTSGLAIVEMITLTDIQDSIRHIRDIRDMVNFHALEQQFYDTEFGHTFWKESKAGRLPPFHLALHRQFDRHWFKLNTAIANDANDCRMGEVDYFVYNDNGTGMMNELKILFESDKDGKKDEAWGFKLALDHVRVTTRAFEDNSQHITQYHQLATFAIGVLIWVNIVEHDDQPFGIPLFRRGVTGFALLRKLPGSAPMVRTLHVVAATWCHKTDDCPALCVFSGQNLCSTTLFWTP